MARKREPTPKPPQNEPAGTNMLKSVSLLIFLQLTSRLLTFTFNQLLLRHLTAPLLGLSAQLEVYYLSVVFFARESLRVAIQRQGPATSIRDSTKNGGESQAVVNLGYLSIALGALVSSTLGWLYLASAETAPYLATSVKLYGLASMLELLSEPCFVLMQTRLDFSTRAAAESIATFLRCAVVFSTATYTSDLGVLPFALGQLTYGVTLLLVYIISGNLLAGKLGFSLLPRRTGGGDFAGGYFYKPTVRLAGSMMAQSVVKHILTQGDTFLVSFLSSADVQGVYALANNYGGLLARLLFQPIEESSRSYFSRLLASTPSSKQPSPSLIEAKNSLQILLRLYGLLSIIVISFGPYAAPPLITIVAGSRWIGSGAGNVLAAYCYYIPFLALNGILESFVASVATEKEVHYQSGWMGAFSITFAASAFLFMCVWPWGAVGLVLANAINMGCRILWSGFFIRAFFKRQGVEFGCRGMVPMTAAGLFVTTVAVMSQLDITEEQPVKALAKVAATAVPLLLTFALISRPFLLEVFQSIRSRKK